MNSKKIIKLIHYLNKESIISRIILGYGGDNYGRKQNQ